MGLERLASAYRESGKVIYAYLHNFSCDGIELVDDRYVPRLNFEKMSQEFSAVTGFNGDRDTVAKLFEPGLATTTLVPQFLARIIYAGAVSVLKFKYSNALLPEGISLTKDDEGWLASVDQFIDTYNKNLTPDQFRNINLHLVWMDIENEEEIWNAIVGLANELDVSPEKKLSREQINTVLGNQLFWNFRNRYWEHHETDT